MNQSMTANLADRQIEHQNEIHSDMRSEIHSESWWRWISIATLLLASLFVAGQAMALAPLRMMVKPTDEIQIKGFRGDVEYMVDGSATDIIVSVERSDESQTSAGQDDWQFVLRRDGNLILVQVESPQSKQVWREMMVKMEQQPKFNLKIKAPALSTKVNWHEGRFIAKDFKANLHVNIIKGNVDILGGEGELRIDSQAGQLKVLNWKGNAAIETYEGKVEVSGVEGDLKLDNFVGVSRVAGVTGDVKLLSYKGDTRASQIKGRLEFKNGNSPLHIEALQGELRGQSMQGPVFASIQGEANIRVESEEGTINLRMPQSGAWVNLGTVGGSLNVPNFLKLTRLPSQQIRSGKLRGNFGGSVFVRTTSGDIQLK